MDDDPLNAMPALFDAETVLTFRLKARFEGKNVELAERNPKSADVAAGERWICGLRRQPGGYYLADPLHIENGVPDAPARQESEPQPAPHAFEWKLHGDLLHPRDLNGPEDRVALFIDAPATAAGTQALRAVIDWDEALDYFFDSGLFVDAHAYLHEGASAARLTRAHLRGFTFHRITSRVEYDKGPKRRSLLLAEMMTDLLVLSNTYDVAYVFSGESSLIPVVRALRAQGKRIYIVSHAAAISGELAEVASKPIFALDAYLPSFGTWKDSKADNES